MRHTPVKYRKPKIDLRTAEWVLWFYLLPAYVKIGRDGRQKNVLFRGIDNIKDRGLAMERLLRLPTMHKGKYYICFLKEGLKGPTRRVWQKDGREIALDDWNNRKHKHERSFLRLWVLPHGHLLETMKKLGLVKPDSRGLTWYSTDIDINPESGDYRKGYDVAVFSLLHQLSQIRGRFAEARIYDNHSHSGAPLAVVNHLGHLALKEKWLEDELVNSNFYQPYQLGLIDYYYD